MMMHIPNPLTPDGRVFYEKTHILNCTNIDAGKQYYAPLVYIVIPTYRSGSTLEKTIRSLLLQEYPRLEIVVYDGGSTEDETLDILGHYKKFIHRIESKPDNGQADVINKGFSIAPDCAILGWLNADDILLPQAIWGMVSYISGNSDTSRFIEEGQPVMLVGDADLVDIDLKLINARRLSDKQLDPKCLIDYRNNYIIQPSCFFTKSLWDIAGPNNKDLYAAFDFELFFKMSKMAKKKVHIPIVMSYSVFHEDCKTVRQKHLSIAETALIQAREGGFEHALREVRDLSSEYKFLERVLVETKYTKPAILISITEFGLGGAQTYLITLLSRIAEDFRIYLYRHWTHRTSQELLEEASRYCEDITGYISNTVEGMCAFIKCKGIRLVLSNLYHSDSFMASVCSGIDARLIVVDHGDYRFVVEDGHASIDDVRHIFSTAYKVIYTSHKIKDEALARYFETYETAERKLEYIPLPCNRILSPYSTSSLSAALDLPADSFLVSYSGRGIVSKGWSFAFSSILMANTISSRPIALIGTGSGPTIDLLANQCQDNPTECNLFRFLGFQKDAPHISAACNAAMMLSYYPGETLNLTLVESLLAGNPCISTDWGAMGEVLEFSSENPSGISVAMHNGYPSVRQAAEALVYLSNDQGAYATLKNNANKRSYHFDSKRVCEIYCDLMTLWATT